MEFVGDAVLNCVVGTVLYERFPALPEGDLSRARAGLVNGDTLARVARRLGIGHEILLGEGEAKSGGADRASILADALEALFGAVYLDGGFDAARARHRHAATRTSFATPIRERWARIRRRACRSGFRRGAGRCPSTWSPRRAATRTSSISPWSAGFPALAIVTSGEGSSRRAAEQAAAEAASALAMAAERKGPAMASDRTSESNRGRQADPCGAQAAFRCGHVAIVGRPSVGKSTLLNALVGQKISITSKKPQTTRYRITGIATDAQAQFVFVDTPGFQTKHRSRLNDRLNRAVRESLAGRRCGGAGSRRNACHAGGPRGGRAAAARTCRSSPP